MSITSRIKIWFAQFTDPVLRVLILFLTCLGLALIHAAAHSTRFDQNRFLAGQIAPYSIRAPRDLMVEDVLATAREKLDAERAVRRVFELDDENTPTNNADLENLFESINNYTENPGAKSGIAVLEPEEKEEIKRSFSLSFSPEEWEALSERENWSELKKSISQLLYPILRRGVIIDKSPIESVLAHSGATLFRRSSGTESPLLSESIIYDLDEAKELFGEVFPGKGLGRGDAFNSIAKKIGLSLIRPNVRYHRERTEARLQQARDRVKSVYYEIKRGEIIVRAGDQITVNEERKLESLVNLLSEKQLLRSSFGYFVVLVSIFSIIYLFLIKNWQKFRPTLPDLIILSLTLISSILFDRLASVVGGSLSFTFPDYDPSTFYLIAPLAVGGTLIQCIRGSAYVLFYVLAFALITGLSGEEYWVKVLCLSLGSFVGSVTVRRASKRSIFLLAAFRVALLNTLIVFASSFLLLNQSSSVTAVAVLCAAVGGLFSGILALALLPVAEYLGGYVTPVKLLELASLDRPLLRELSIEAPGTWSHSMIVGQLGESAAEAVGAFPLLTRVGAYYHDIGKAKKPKYFVENQADRDSKHDKLTPSMSALIIRAHVKDGIEMAKAARVPQTLIDFIPQHHGTALIEYFYDKAVKEAEPGEIIDENLFRYPGPKPQTREAGILMLADQVEAVSRLILDPTPAKIQGMVQKVINRVFVSGQLDESELTLKDLHVIARSFTRVLAGLIHRRIEYPEHIDRNSGELKASEKKESTKGGEDVTQKLPHVEDLTSHEKNGSKKTDKVEKALTTESEKALKRLGL